MPISSLIRSAIAGVILTTALVSGTAAAQAAPTAPAVVQQPAVIKTLTSVSKPTIVGKHKVGVRLKASYRAWKPGTVKMRYVWKRSGVAISGADHRTYTVRKADRGHRLTVTIVGKKSGYHSAKRTSASISIPRPRPASNAGCDPNYSGCVPIASDVDCVGGSGNGPAYVEGPVRVIGRDIYGLDFDGDGIGCE